MNLQSDQNYTIREATPTDVPDIFRLINGLAEFERAPEQVTNTEDSLLLDGFGQNPAYKAFVAEINGSVVGFALSYIRYSTWKGKMVYLEDIFVEPAYRSAGLGSQLLEQILAFAKSLGIAYLSFQVLDWNTEAIRFYKRFHASFDPEWVNVRIEVPSATKQPGEGS